MSERLPTHTINIPNAVGSESANVIDVLREAGIDPRKAMRNAMAIALVEEWREGRVTRGQIIHAFRKLLILNPGLAG